MTHYLEFTLKSSKKTPTPVIMSALLNHVHHTLVKLETVQLGVSFPGYGTTLGSVLRLHGEHYLLKLFVMALDRLPQEVIVSDIRLVPDVVRQACFYRVRTSKQNSKLQAGLKSGHITNAKEYVVKMCQEVLNTPYFYSQSTSTGQGYKRFIGYSEVDSGASGEFDSFGLSKTASVPVF